MRRRSFAAGFLLIALAGAAGADRQGEPAFGPVDKRAAARVEEFFALLSARDVPGALELLSAKAAPDPSARRSWAGQLGAMQSVRVRKLSPTALEGQSDRRRTYKVLVDVVLHPSAARAPIPNYGWGDNPNVRWITVELEPDGAWRIVTIATGP